MRQRDLRRRPPRPRKGIPPRRVVAFGGPGRSAWRALLGVPSGAAAAGHRAFPRSLRACATALVPGGAGPVPRHPGEGDSPSPARSVGVVTQDVSVAFPISVRDYVSMGRCPHLGAIRGENAKDRRAVAAAPQACSVADHADRWPGTLSGWVRQRARIARSMAKEPDALVLDESTASLDLRREIAILHLLRFADRILLLDGGQGRIGGNPGRSPPRGYPGARLPVARGRDGRCRHRALACHALPGRRKGGHRAPSGSERGGRGARNPARAPRRRRAGACQASPSMAR